ncbi:hexokinase-3-like [Argiope bruennichi]|uniref:hexokinase-3-like n=1 Tax=Argiope bruennichi TaxID=94029 RepID=UPI002494A7C6|nr:hexokinase-3-like [Argiope bruennichi]
MPEKGSSYLEPNQGCMVVTPDLPPKLLQKSLCPLQKNDAISPPVKAFSFDEIYIIREAAIPDIVQMVHRERSAFRIKLQDKYKANLIEEYMSQYILSDEKINLIKRNFEKEFEDGLRRFDDTAPRDPNARPDDPVIQDTSTLGMKVTFFAEFFNGTENGDFIVIYLNRRYLMVMLAKVKPGFPVETQRDYFIVSENVRRSPYIKIYEYICDCLLAFLSKLNLLNETHIVGFCSDFPIIQLGIDDGTVWYFTESASDFPLNCYNIRQCFEMVLLRERYHAVKIELVAILNNNTSMYINSCYLFGEIDMFLNFVDDCDLLYCENTSKIKKWNVLNIAERILIDTELRNFGGNGGLDFIASDLERLAVTTSVTTDKRATLEKFVSEQYILEEIKYILVDLYHKLLYCRNTSIEKLQTEGVSVMELCSFTDAKELEHLARLLPGGTTGGSIDDAKIALYVIKIVLVRAAVLISMCISRVMSRFLKEDFIIVVNYPLLRKHPDYETYIRNVTMKFMPEKKFQILWAEDSFNLNGAALATALAHRLDRKKLHF